MQTNCIVVTGGAGFIGVNFIRHWLASEAVDVVNLDKLTYAGNLASLRTVEKDPRYAFVQADIADSQQVAALLSQRRPTAVINFAAESHVDRSIHGPEDFIQTNLVGTFRLLDVVREYWSSLAPDARRRFRFVHISTDEVYGSLEPGDPPFTERASYFPNSPYAASKAGGDHLVRAYCKTYGLPAITTNCSNNYGPYQFPEKLIPLIILNALEGKPLPIYGDGTNVRDWLYVEDHCAAVRLVLNKGRPGETYNIGGMNERTNLEVVRTICRSLDELQPSRNNKPYESLITFVADRPGHDRRYAIDPSKIRDELGWNPMESFKTGILKTIHWYLDHGEWLKDIAGGNYKKWVEHNYGRRGES